MACYSSAIIKMEIPAGQIRSYLLIGPKEIFPDGILLKYNRNILREVRHLQHEKKREKGS